MGVPVPMVMIVMAILVMMVVMAMVVVMMAMVMSMAVRVRLNSAVLSIANVDARLALAASANPAHQSTSNSLIRNSSPPVACTWKLPQLGHTPLRSDIVMVSPQEKHQADAGVVMISSFAFSAIVPRVAASKENRIASGSTAASGPISSHTVFTRL